MPKYNALVDAAVTENLNPGVRARLELIGSAGQTPVVKPWDGLRLELKRRSPGQGSPALREPEPVQVLNGTVLDVHNEAPADPSVVNITIEGCAPGLEIYPGDSLEAELAVVSSASPLPPYTPEGV